MNEREVAAIVRGITPSLRQHIESEVAKALASVQAENAELKKRLETIETTTAKPVEIDLRQAQKLIGEVVSKTVAGLPPPRSVAGVVVNRDGDGIYTFTDGTTQNIGRVIGKDGEPGPRGEAGPKGEDGKDGERGEKGDQGPSGERGDQGPAGSDGTNGDDGRDGADVDMDALRAHIEELIAAIPVPKDGKDGVDGKDAYPGEAKGLFSPEAEYLARDVVQLNGSAWMAKVDAPGECPGDGWMLLAGRGKRGDRGERGERGIEGKAGKDGAQPIGLKFEEDTMKFVMVLDDGNQLDADFYPIAKAIRGEE